MMRKSPHENEAHATAAIIAKMQGAEGKLRDLEDQLKYAPQTLEDAQEDLVRARARGSGENESASECGKFPRKPAR
jgi:hypothetical protein